MYAVGGALVAYSSVCTHLSCTVLWNGPAARIDCPCHDGRFDPLDGRVLAGPPPRPLPKIELVERQDGSTPGMVVRAPLIAVERVAGFHRLEHGPGPGSRSRTGSRARDDAPRADRDRRRDRRWSTVGTHRRVDHFEHESVAPLVAFEALSFLVVLAVWLAAPGEH